MAKTDSLEKGLKRGDAVMAFDGLIRLSDAERAPWLDRLGALVVQSIHTLHEKGDWSALIAWASRLERVPAVFSAFDEAARPSVRWALGWAAFRTKDPARVGRWLELVLSDLPDGPLCAAMWSALRGEADPSMSQWAPLESNPVSDPRLGHGRQRALVPLEPPAGAEDVSERVLAARGTRTFGEFVALCSKWVGDGQGVCAKRVALLAARLALKEALEHPGSCWHALAAFSDFARAVEPSELESLLTLALRLAHSHRTVQRSTAAWVADAFPVLSLSMGNAPLRPLVLASLRELKAPRGGDRALVSKLEALAQVHPDPSVIGKALELLAAGDPTRAESFMASRTLSGLVHRSLTTQPAGFFEWQRRMEAESAANLSAWAGFNLPLDVLEVWVLEGLVQGDERIHDLARSMFEDLLIRFQPTPQIELNDEYLFRPLPPPLRGLWTRARAQLIRGDADLVGFALRNAPSEWECVVDEALSGPFAAPFAVSVWEEARATKPPKSLLNTIERRLLEASQSDVRLLSEVLVVAARRKLPKAFMKPFAQALLKHPAREGPTFEAARRLALVAAPQRPPRLGKAKSTPRAPKNKAVASKTDDLPF
jgi:hypothetical protein